jgi:hypothetical protein
MIHKAVKGVAWLIANVHEFVWAGMGLFVLWSATLTLLLLPITRIVIDAGPKGNSDANANTMEIFGGVVGVVTICLTIWWVYSLEEALARRKVKKAESAVLNEIDSLRLLRDTEELLGLEPYPLDNELEKYLYDRHPFEYPTRTTESFSHYFCAYCGRGTYSDVGAARCNLCNYAHRKVGGDTGDPGRVRSQGYETLKAELTVS